MGISEVSVNFQEIHEKLGHKGDLKDCPECKVMVEGQYNRFLRSFDQEFRKVNPTPGVRQW